MLVIGYFIFLSFLAGFSKSSEWIFLKFGEGIHFGIKR